MHEDDGVRDNRVNHEASAGEATGLRGPHGVQAARRGGLAALVVGYAWWAVSLPSFSGTATVAVVAGGLAAAASGAARRRPGPGQRDVRAGAWAVLGVATAAWELAAYLQHPRADHPTLSSLANGVLDSHPARAAAFVLWLLGSAEVARR